MIGHRHTIDVYADGRARVKGLETGPLTVFSYHASYHGDTGHLVLYEAGHKYWSAIGRQGYAPAEWHVYDIDDYESTGDGDGRWVLRGIHAATIPVTTSADERDIAGRHVAEHVFGRHTS